MGARLRRLRSQAPQRLSSLPATGASREKGALPQALQRLHGLIHNGLDRTAPLWPTVRAASPWVQRVTEMLTNAKGLDGNSIKRPCRALLAL